MLGKKWNVPKCISQEHSTEQIRGDLSREDWGSIEKQRLTSEDSERHQRRYRACNERNVPISCHREDFSRLGHIPAIGGLVRVNRTQRKLSTRNIRGNEAWVYVYPMRVCRNVRRVKVRNVLSEFRDQAAPLQGGGLPLKTLQTEKTVRTRVHERYKFHWILNVPWDMSGMFQD